MKTSPAKAWGIGAAIVLIARVIFLATILLGDHAPPAIRVFALLSYYAPAGAAFVVGHLAPRRKFLLGLSMAVPAAILDGALNFGLPALGHPVDFLGVEAGTILVVIDLIFQGALCAVGAVLGWASSPRASQ